MPLAVLAVLVVGALVAVGAIVAALSWRVPEADEALVVTGWHPRVIRRRGTLVWPRLERSCRVDLALHELGTDVSVISAEGIGFVVTLRGSWRVRSEEASIVDAARLVGRPPGQAERHVLGSVAARVRAAVGAAPAVTLLDGGRPDELAVIVAAGVATDIHAWGIVLDSLEVCAIGDTTGYLADLTRPRLAQAASAARIAVARAEAAAVEAEQVAARTKDRAWRDAEVARVAGAAGGRQGRTGLPA